MKINIVSAQAKPVASNLSAREFLADAHTRFPQPSPFLVEFLRRFEELVELDEAVDRKHFEEAEPGDIECPACGTQISIEVEYELSL